MWDTICNFHLQHMSYNLNKRPYALVFTKFDAVIDNCDDLNCSVDTLLDDNDNFKNSSYLTGRENVVSMDEMKDCNDAIESYLRDENVWNEEGFLSNIKYNWGDNSQFFGVSALGGMTDYSYSIQTKGENVKPIRVLDPLVWILIKLGDFGIKCK